MSLKRWARRVLLGIATLAGVVALLIAAGVWYVRSHSAPQTSLDTEEGQALLRRNATSDYEPLARQWVQQGQMLCCAAAAVTVMKSLHPGTNYTQGDLFVPETAQIITLDEFQRGQATLDKVAALIRARAGLSVSANHAETGPGESNLEAFRRQLQRNSRSAEDYMIVNYSLAHLAGLGKGGGHCSPVAAYDEEQDRVLLLDPRGRYHWAWVAAADLFLAMDTIDDVSQEHRGWLTVTQ